WKWEEALALQTEFASRKATYSQLQAPPLLEVGPKSRRFDQSLPFELTASQTAVGEEIAADLAGSAPMHRLLHGDVGSGKTAVATDPQAAMLARTEVLSNKHFHCIDRLLGRQMSLSPLLAGDDHVTVTLMTGSMPAWERRELALDMAAANIDIVVGMHALLSE